MVDCDGKKVGARGGGLTKKTNKQESRAGLPAEASILSEKTFISPRNKRYRIITTSERDSYDEPDLADEKKRP